jgi:hypothetical protein
LASARSGIDFRRSATISGVNPMTRARRSYFIFIDRGRLPAFRRDQESSIRRRDACAIRRRPSGVRGPVDMPP